MDFLNNEEFTREEKNFILETIVTDSGIGIIPER